MKTLFLECNMGASGDMLMAALLELFEEPERFIRQINELGLPGIRVSYIKDKRQGITGTKVSVVYNGKTEGLHKPEAQPEAQPEAGEGRRHNASVTLHKSDSGDISREGSRHGEHTGTGRGGTVHVGRRTGDRDAGAYSHSVRSLSQIHKIIKDLPLNELICKNAIEVYDRIAQAESVVHGVPVTEVHFHELGMMDAVCDIVGVCMLMNELAPDNIVVSPVNVGSGTVDSEHGTLPVPAPATALLLEGVPVYSSGIKGELCTPTGAALLSCFADSYGSMPAMITEKIGYGLGSKKLAAANFIRAFYGKGYAGERANAEIAVLECNLDDMTGEAIGAAIELLFTSGALDVFLTAVQMKKNRPGSLLSCICDVGKADYFAELMLKHTSSFGIRMHIARRYELERETHVVSTEYGDVRIKTGSGFGIEKSKIEYEDVINAAREGGVAFTDILERMR